MGDSSRLHLNFSCDMSSSHYFKSSFAKSMAADFTNRSKSLEYGRFNNSKTNRELFSVSDQDKHSPFLRENTTLSLWHKPNLLREEQSKMNGTIKHNFCGTEQNWNSREDSEKTPVVGSPPRVGPTVHSHSNQSDVLRLRKECQGLLEENRRLQSVLEAPSHPADNHIRKVDSAILQSQVETLRWQLEQTEASREMYRAVMEQVLKFLEKVHKNLEMTASDEGSPYSIKDMSRCRVPRSRSVHTVDPSPTRSLPKTESVSYFSRAKSTAQIEESQSHTAFRDFTWRRPRKLRSDPDEVPPEKLSQEAFRLFRTVQSLLNTSEPNLAQRLSISDCGDQSSVSSRATICGGTPSTRERHEDVGAVQDASYSLPFTDSASQRSSRASKGEHCSAMEVPLDLRSNCGERTYNASPSVGSCSSLIQESYRKSPSIKSNSSKTLHPSGFANTALTTGLEASFSGCIQFSPNYTASLGRHRKIRVPNSTTTETEYYPYSGSNGCDGNKPPEKQLSISSNEDESGFSSMSSFQEVGLPIVNISPPISPEGKANYPEIGLPLVEHPPAPNGNNANHRRWSSSPVDTHSQFHKRLGTFTPSGEKLKVLWV